MILLVFASISYHLIVFDLSFQECILKSFSIENPNIEYFFRESHAVGIPIKGPFHGIISTLFDILTSIFWYWYIILIVLVQESIKLCPQWQCIVCCKKPLLNTVGCLLWHFRMVIMTHVTQIILDICQLLKLLQKVDLYLHIWYFRNMGSS